MMQHDLGNPFSITKSTDLSDRQILELWVDVAGEEALNAVARPASPMPMLILGGKGSGKTHLMRYFSFALQRLRYEQSGIDYLSGVSKDGFIGIYLRCGGLNSERFSGKRQSDEVWKDLFAYYAELWLSQGLLSIASTLCSESQDFRAREAGLAKSVSDLFDRWPYDAPQSLADLNVGISKIQKDLDYKINNASLTGRLDVEILSTRGALVFGIPKCIYDALRPLGVPELNFVYMLDEFENLTADQQKFVNTLVREKEVPATFKIGARLYGVKTYQTYSGGEENLKDSEYDFLPLDQRLRNSNRYADFCRSLVCKRLEEANVGIQIPNTENSTIVLNSFFDTIDESWNSPYWLDAVEKYQAGDRPYIHSLRQKLESGLRDGIAPGLEGADAIEAVVDAIRCRDYPLVEKACILVLYQGWADGQNLSEIASFVKEQRDIYLSSEPSRSKLKQTLGHFGNDLAAQLVRECKLKSNYGGIEDFITMSEGLPRTLVTVLKNIYDWSVFNGETPFQRGRISLPSQRKGVLDTSDWFFESMRKAGRDGVIVQTAIDRFAQLCRMNRFSDKPIECSLIAFSVSEGDLSEESRRIIDIARTRSFLIPITGGQKDKNSEQVDAKYQLNRMLCPRWDLPLGRRGAIALSAEMANSIFEYEAADKFKVMLTDFEQRVTAPHFGKKPKKTTRRKTAKSPMKDLFGHD